MDVTQLVITLVAVLGIVTVAVLAVVPTVMEIPATVHHRDRPTVPRR